MQDKNLSFDFVLVVLFFIFYFKVFIYNGLIALFNV